jgi:hypothetical protein
MPAMDLAWTKLFLALLWLLPGVGLLALEWAIGRVVAVPVGGRQVPLAWPCLLLGAFNLARWYAARRRPAARRPPRRERRREAAAEPDSAFRFDEPEAPL